MGNGIPFNMICCNQNKESNAEEDVDINKNYIEYNKNYKTIKLSNNKLNKDKNFINNFNKRQTFTISSASDSKKKLKQIYRKDSASHKDPNISLFNNTFQILNNTQQYISFSNMNLYKNNILNNQLFKNYYNSKINSSFINSNLECNLADIKVNTRLLLSGELFLNNVIEIDKYGMKNGLRQKNDGVTIFGYKEDNNNSNISSYDYLLDIKFEKNTKSNKKRNLGKVFEIILDRREKVYILYYRHNSLLLYYQINDSLYFELDKDYFLILGDIFVSVTVKRAMNTNEKIINFRVEVENEKPKKYSYEQKDVPIKIGRADCHINIPKPSISKLHSIIDFDNDMFYYNDKKSTNGSTLLLKEDDVLKIKGEMNFKLEDIPFKIKEIIIDEK